MFKSTETNGNITHIREGNQRYALIILFITKAKKLVSNGVISKITFT